MCFTSLDWSSHGGKMTTLQWFLFVLIFLATSMEFASVLSSIRSRPLFAA